MAAHISFIQLLFVQKEDEETQRPSLFHVDGLKKPQKRSCHLGGEVPAELELLERHRHGVGAEEEDEGHEGQIGDVLAGLSDQRASVF